MADNKKSSFSGAERAAVLLMALGEQNAAAVMKHMSPKEVQRIGSAMTALTSISKDQVSTILSEFMQIVDNQTSLGVGNEEYIKKVLVSALGEDKASSLIDRILMGTSTKGLEALKWMDPRAVAELIRHEHPQIMAIVISYLESDHAAEVMANLPERVRPDVIMRVATLDGVHPSALIELDEIMEKQFSGNSNVKSSTVGGKKTAANIMNFLDGNVENEIMNNIKESDPELGQQIEELMFVFENIAEIDDRGIQALLREISSETLILALKGADDTIKTKIFKNMSKRASEMLREDLEARGPVRLSDVETAQKEILAVARRLADSGEISIGGTGEEFVT